MGGRLGHKKDYTLITDYMGGGVRPAYIKRKKAYCRTQVLGVGLGFDFVFAKNRQSLRNRMAEPPQPEP